MFFASSEHPKQIQSDIQALHVCGVYHPLPAFFFPAIQAGLDGDDADDNVDSDSDEDRGMPSFKISKTRHKRGGSGGGADGGLFDGQRSSGKAVKPLAGPGAPGGGGILLGGNRGQKEEQPVTNLLDLDDLFGGGGGGGGDAGSGGGVGSGAASPPGVSGAATVDLMADIFAAPAAMSAPPAIPTSQVI